MFCRYHDHVTDVTAYFVLEHLLMDAMAIVGLGVVVSYLQGGAKRQLKYLANIKPTK